MAVELKPLALKFRVRTGHKARDGCYAMSQTPTRLISDSRFVGLSSKSTRFLSFHPQNCARPARFPTQQRHQNTMGRMGVFGSERCESHEADSEEESDMG